jgi:hypothetical protein
MVFQIHLDGIFSRWGREGRGSRDSKLRRDKRAALLPNPSEKGNIALSLLASVGKAVRFFNRAGDAAH